ncbi:MAG TPA: TIGR03790 family protein [Verrucomicrobiae bacterium]|nr:TIGR03790 family protein [Verrucomicrobiae bacterium]
MGKILKIIALFAVTSALHAAGPGDEVVVIYNKRMPGSQDVAEHYAERRQVPASQVFGFNLTTNESMSRTEYRDSLEKPLAKMLEDKKLWHIGSEVIHNTNNPQGKVIWKVQQSKILYAVLCYGVPIRIDNDPGLREENSEKVIEPLRRNEAAVDSELALLPRTEQHYPLTGPVVNPFYTLTNAALFHPTNNLLMVTRLDGPSAAIARGLVDKAMEAESNGLCGRAYIDIRSVETNSPYYLGDEWILGAGKICQLFAGYDTIYDTNAATFPADATLSQIAFYCGWYDESAHGPFALPTVEFMPGAFAYHLHSFSAATIRSTTRQWVGPLLAKGATATMGCVAEPTLGGTPDVSVFAARWMVMGFTFGEAAYASQQTLSWQTIVVGDPLYRPFGKSLQTLVDEQQDTKSKWLEWSYLRAVNIGLLHGKRPAETAQFVESLPILKQSPVLLEKLGDLYYALGKPASTIEAYENCLKVVQSPLQRVRVRLYLANVLTEQNKNQEAADDLKELLNESPDYPGRADVEKKLHDLAEKNTAASAKANP